MFSRRGGGGGATLVNFCWVCAAGLSEPLPHYSLNRGIATGGNSRQTLIARISCHLHTLIYITHLTKIPTWKLFTEKSKAEKSPWVKKTKKTDLKKNKRDKKNVLQCDVFPAGGGGGYFGQFLLGMCRWPLRAPTPL